MTVKAINESLKKKKDQAKCDSRPRTSRQKGNEIRNFGRRAGSTMGPATKGSLTSYLS